MSHNKHIPIKRIRHLPPGTTIKLDGVHLYLGEHDRTDDRALLWKTAADYRAGKPWLVNISGCYRVST